MTDESKDFWKHFKLGACSVRLKGSTKEDVFGEILDNLVKGKELDGALRAAALEALLERERLASTGVGQRVAVPHVKLRGIDEAVFSLCVHKEGVAWNALDGAPVSVFFTVLRPERASARHDPERHLVMMRWISRMCRASDFRRFVVAVEKKSELVELLKEMSTGVA
jgi:mannitol/fructose-specific phosphotransferase system IIA component (Ntr-type)